MNITKDNVGDILCFYETGKQNMVALVKDNIIVYRTETGQHLGSRKFSVSAVVEKDPDRIERFHSNAALGAALCAAENKALDIIESGRGGEEVSLAHRILDIVDLQRKHMEDRILGDLSLYPIGKGVAEGFLSQLYEQGTGSHDTIMGHRIENVSSHTGTFRINGKEYDYTAAVSALSTMKREPAIQRKASLDNKISDAIAHRNMALGPYSVIKENEPER